ncbi:hypothetical protein KALB_700 [Kutzneria albida DSM 43870]|uniref:Uncharacterized protein n=1 Tax=Kutzneria albida DSM 43870 TaxID=1449976 RepID=W5VZZ0_9PSEU|nr:hypothetical protein KALB_700 [Kutzneria albida DSM 43870]
MPALVQALDPLGTGDRRLLLDALDELLDVPLSPAVHRAVLPDARTSDQQYLEAGILYAASRVSPAAVFRMVRPLGHELWLHIRDEAVTPLLAELLPRVTTNGLGGVPGLRISLYRRHIELYLVDSDARVLLSGVTYRQWADTLSAFSTCGDVPLWGQWKHPHPLTDTERAASRREHVAAAAVSSALLRRISLFTTVPRIVHSPFALGACGVDWSEGPSTSEIAGVLMNPVCGLPNGLADACLVTDRYLTLKAATGSPSVLLSGPDLPALDLAPTRQQMSRLRAS